ADDRPRELAAHAIERVEVLLKERPRIERARAARRFVLLAEEDTRDLPHYLVFAKVLQLDFRDHRNRVPRRDLRAREARRRDRHAGDFSVQQCVDAGAFGQDLILAAADEFGADFLRQQCLQVEYRRPVDEGRHANRVDVSRQKRAVASERVPAGRGQRRENYNRRQPKISTTEDTGDTEIQGQKDPTSVSTVSSVVESFLSLWWRVFPVTAPPPTPKVPSQRRPC